jgi:hypothetical protein
VLVVASLGIALFLARLVIPGFPLVPIAAIGRGRLLVALVLPLLLVVLGYLLDHRLI